MCRFRAGWAARARPARRRSPSRRRAQPPHAPPRVQTDMADAYATLASPARSDFSLLRPRYHPPSGDLADAIACADPCSRHIHPSVCRCPIWACDTREATHRRMGSSARSASIGRHDPLASSPHGTCAPRCPFLVCPCPRRGETGEGRRLRRCHVVLRRKTGSVEQPISTCASARGERSREDASARTATCACGPRSHI